MEATDTAVDPPATKSARSRVRILDATARLLSERGYAETSLAAIAEAAGLKVGSLYYYFDAKDELIYEVLRLGIERSFEPVREAVLALGPHTDPATRLGVAIEAHLQSLHAQGDYAIAGLRILEHAPEPLRRRQYENHRAYGEYWHGLLAEAQAAGALAPEVDLVTARLLLFGAMNSSIDWPRPARRPAEEVARTLMELVGLGGAPGREHAPSALTS